MSALGPRVVVIGTSGAGKSFVAERLAARRGVPFIELDALHWGGNWTPAADFLAEVDRMTQAPAWIVAGHYAAARPLLWARATDVVWLDLPLPLMLWRVTLRSLRRVCRRERLWHGNRETWRSAVFSRESVLWWALKSHGQRQRSFEALQAQDPSPRWHRLRRRVEVATLLQRG